MNATDRPLVRPVAGSPLFRTNKGDLISYFCQNRETIEPRTFAREVLPEAHQVAFVKRCRDEGIGQAFSKELDMIKGKLRR